MMGLKQAMTRLRIRKRAAIVLSVFSVLILVGLGVLLSVRAWGDYETSYNTSFGSAKTAIDEALLPVSTKSPITPADKLDQLVQIQSIMKEGVKSYCTVSPVIKWQGFINQYAHKVSDCETKRDNFTEFLSKLTNVTAYFKAEQGLATIIQQADTKTSQNNQPDKWKDVEAFWRQAATEVSKLPETDQFKSVKSANITKIIAVADAWKGLSDANDAKISQQFTEARLNLGVVYDSLIEANPSSKASLDNLFVALSASHENID